MEGERENLYLPDATGFRNIFDGADEVRCGNREKIFPKLELKIKDIFIINSSFTRKMEIYVRGGIGGLEGGGERKK